MVKQLERKKGRKKGERVRERRSGRSGGTQEKEGEREIVIKDKWGQGDTGECLVQVICFY